MSKPALDPEYASRLAFYDRLVATNPKVQRKGDTVPNTTVNGHMFSYFGKSGELALRLPEEERAIFLRKYKTKLFEAHGAVMKEYVTVLATMLKSTKGRKKYLEFSYEYAKALKAKPSWEKS